MTASSFKLAVSLKVATPLGLSYIGIQIILCIYILKNTLIRRKFV